MKRICFSVVILTLTCGSVGAQDTEANKEVVQRWIEAVWQDHDRSHIRKNATADFAVENYEAWFDSITTTYPDARVEILNMIAEGDEVALHWEFTGTSSLAGTAGRGVKMPGLSIVKIDGGKLLPIYSPTMTWKVTGSWALRYGLPKNTRFIRSFSIFTKVSKTIRMTMQRYSTRR